MPVSAVFRGRTGAIPGDLAVNRQAATRLEPSSGTVHPSVYPPVRLEHLSLGYSLHPKQPLDVCMDAEQTSNTIFSTAQEQSRETQRVSHLLHFPHSRVKLSWSLWRASRLHDVKAAPWCFAALTAQSRQATLASPPGHPPFDTTDRGVRPSCRQDEPPKMLPQAQRNGRSLEASVTLWPKHAQQPRPRR